MIPVTAFAASVPIAVLASLVVAVITLVNRIGRQAGTILDHLTATGERAGPLLDLVEANVHLETIATGTR